MTTPKEASTLNHTRQFLNALTDPNKIPYIPDNVRRQANFLLKHYPQETELKQTAKKKTNPSI